MKPEHHVKLFRNGRNQAVRIPQEFEIEGNEAILRKDRVRLIIESIRTGGVLASFKGVVASQRAIPRC